MDAEHKMHSTQMHSTMMHNTMMHSTQMHSTQTHITRMHSTWMHHAQSLGCTWARAWMHARSAGDARLRSETEKWSTKIMTSCIDKCKAKHKLVDTKREKKWGGGDRCYSGVSKPSATWPSLTGIPSRAPRNDLYPLQLATLCWQ